MAISYKHYAQAVTRKEGENWEAENRAWSGSQNPSISEKKKLQTNNPSCPECQGTTQKWGTYPARSGKVQKYKCTSCGKVFTQPQGNGAKSEE